MPPATPFGFITVLDPLFKIVQDFQLSKKKKKKKNKKNKKKKKKNAVTAIARL